MMESKKSLPSRNQQTLESVQKRFQQWRENREKGERIPRELWERACQLFPLYSINQISRGLKLDYVGLRNRIKPALKEDKEPHFVEFSMGKSQRAVDCKLKMRDNLGGRIKIKIKKASVGRVIELMSGLTEGSL